MDPCPAPFNLAAHALRHATDQPGKVALEILHRGGAERLRYGDLAAEVRGVGTGLLRRGLRPGDRVMLRLGNSLAFPLAYLGAIAAGIVPVPTAAGLTRPEVSGLAAQLGPCAVIAEPGLALPDPCPPLIGLSDLMAMTGLPPCDWDMGPPDRLAYVVFTSGTSGRPMPVAHAHRALWARRMMQHGWEGLGPTDRLFHAGALNWTFTLGTGLLDPWVAGATALIAAPGTEVAEMPALVARHGASILAGAPGVFRQMLRAGLPPLPALRHGLAAGESLAPTLRADWQAATGTDLHEALGMTECSTFLSGSPDRPAPPGTAGFAQQGRRLAVLAEDGTSVQPGQPGLLAVHRSDPGLMLGYLDRPEATAARFLGDWFVPGDLVQQTPDGAFRHLGRADDLLNPGGFRIAPQEVEAWLATHPALTDCAVTEVEPRPGIRILACAYVAPAALPESLLAAHAAQGLADYKRPRLWLRLDHLPRNPNMKLNRRALRAALQERLNDPS